jgi:beta-xylosidase
MVPNGAKKLKKVQYYTEYNQLYGNKNVANTGFIAI